MHGIRPGGAGHLAAAPAPAAPAAFEATLQRVLAETMDGAMRVAQDRVAALPAGTPTAIAIEVAVAVGPDGRVTIDERIDVRAGDRPAAAPAPIAPAPFAPAPPAGGPAVLRPG